MYKRFRQTFENALISYQWYALIIVWVQYLTGVETDTKEICMSSNNIFGNWLIDKHNFTHLHTNKEAISSFLKDGRFVTRVYGNSSSITSKSLIIAT